MFLHAVHNPPANLQCGRSLGRQPLAGSSKAGMLHNEPLCWSLFSFRRARNTLQTAMTDRSGLADRPARAVADVCLAAATLINVTTSSTVVPSSRPGLLSSLTLRPSLPLLLGIWAFSIGEQAHSERAYVCLNGKLHYPFAIALKSASPDTFLCSSCRSCLHRPHFPFSISLSFYHRTALNATIGGIPACCLSSAQRCV